METKIEMTQTELVNDLFGIAADFSRAVAEKIDGDHEQGFISDAQREHYNKLLTDFNIGVSTLSRYLNTEKK